MVGLVTVVFYRKHILLIQVRKLPHNTMFTLDAHVIIDPFRGKNQGNMLQGGMGN